MVLSVASRNNRETGERVDNLCYPKRVELSTNRFAFKWRVRKKNGANIERRISFTHTRRPTCSRSKDPNMSKDQVRSSQFHLCSTGPLCDVIRPFLSARKFAKCKYRTRKLINTQSRVRSHKMSATTTTVYLFFRVWTYQISGARFKRIFFVYIYCWGHERWVRWGRLENGLIHIKERRKKKSESSISFITTAKPITSHHIVLFDCFISGHVTERMVLLKVRDGDDEAHFTKSIAVCRETVWIMSSKMCCYNAYDSVWKIRSMGSI